MLETFRLYQKLFQPPGKAERISAARSVSSIADSPGTVKLSCFVTLRFGFHSTADCGPDEVLSVEKDRLITHALWGCYIQTKSPAIIKAWFLLEASSRSGTYSLRFIFTWVLSQNSWVYHIYTPQQSIKYTFSLLHTHQPGHTVFSTVPIVRELQVHILALSSSGLCCIRLWWIRFTSLSCICTFLTSTGRGTHRGTVEEHMWSASLTDLHHCSMTTTLH